MQADRQKIKPGKIEPVPSVLFNTGGYVLAEIGDMNSTRWTLGLIDSLDNKEFCAQIESLAGRTIPPNPFFDFPILSAGTERLAGKEIDYLVLTNTVGNVETLKIFMPVLKERRGFPSQTCMRAWSNFYAPDSTPLFDAEDSEETIRNFANCLLQDNDKAVPTLLFENIKLQSTFVKSLTDVHQIADRMTVGCRQERAALYPIGSKSFEQEFLSAKRRRRLRRGLERLFGHGEVDFEIASDFSKIMLRFEEFLLLEASGWKGAKGTSLQMIKKTAAFARQAIANMANENRCRIFSLRLNGKAVASMIVFNSGPHHYPWKMAYDENYRANSVGVHLILKVNHELLQQSDFAGIDSLAASDNETANNFWPHRIEMGSIAIGLSPTGKTRATRLISSLERWQNFKKVAKRLLRK